MKRLLIGISVVCVLGGIAWGVGAMATQSAASRWLDDRQANGWVAEAETTVGGFPLAFRTQFAGLELADPATGLAWSAPEFRLEQSLLRLDQLAAFWPSEQTLASPDERLTLISSAMDATFDVQPTNRFALDAIRAQVADLTVQSNAGWATSMDRAELSAARVPEAEQVYFVDLTATGMVPPEVWRDRLDPGGLLPNAIDRVLVDTTITFDAPWDMGAIEVARPQITQLQIDDITAAWGDMLFRATGTLEVTAGGVPEGDLAVRAENWRAMVELASNAGIVPERLRTTAEAMLQVLAGMNGSAENIDATLSFSNGRVFIGPLPIGPAPSLRLR